jgi:hypothetical protein
VTELEQALDELYGADLDEFVATRKRLAKGLKDAGAAAAAATVASSRKPTLAAWAVNRLARMRRKEVDLLLDAGHRLRQAHAALLRGGDQREFEAARRAEQAALAALTKAARELLAGGSPATLVQVEETLRAASTTDEGRELLARGRFEKAYDAPGGFDVLAAFAPAGPPPSPRRRRDRGAAVREAKARLRAAERELRRLERDADAAEREIDRLAEELRQAGERRDQARAAADEAADAVAAAEAELREADEQG